MTGRELASNINYIGQERKARQLLLDDKIRTAQEVALMTTEDVCDALLDKYKVIAIEEEDVILIDSEFAEECAKHIRHLER